MTRPFLTSEWLDLVLLQYEVPEGALVPFLPARTALDLWNGKALVSLVGFHFERTRVLGTPIPFHRAFPEVNLRFYVRRDAPDGARGGVVFIREIAPRLAITLAAKALYNEPYVRRSMRQAHDRDGHRYEWGEKGAWNSVAATAAGPEAFPEPGSLGEFVTVRHWGYSRQRDGGTLEYEVRHPRWPLRHSADAKALGDLTRTYGPTFGPLLSGAPTSAFVAAGSEVKVFPGREI